MTLLLFGLCKFRMHTLQAESHWKLLVLLPSKPYTTLYSEWRHLINLFSCNNECWPVADQYCCSQLIASELNAAWALSQDEVRRESLVKDSGPSVERFQICLNQECRTLLLSKKASPLLTAGGSFDLYPRKSSCSFPYRCPFTAEEAPPLLRPPPPATTQHSIPTNQHSTITSISFGKCFPMHLNLSLDLSSCN